MTPPSLALLLQALRDHPSRDVPQRGGDTGPGLGKRQNWLPGMGVEPHSWFSTPRTICAGRSSLTCVLLGDWADGELWVAIAGLAVLKRG